MLLYVLLCIALTHVVVSHWSYCLELSELHEFVDYLVV